MKSNVLVVAVHPDDETLGCGGTLLRHVLEGDSIHWAIVTDMVPDLFSSERIAQREMEIASVGAAYSFSSIHRLGFPTTRLDGVPDGELVDAFSGVFREVKPQTVYLPFMGDVHSDHRKAFSTAFACGKAFRSPFIKRMLMMETLSETEFAPPILSESFIPNVFRNIDLHLERKIEILSLYEGEVGQAPFPRSPATVRALAGFRGAVAGCIAAEAFMLVKDVD